MTEEEEKAAKLQRDICKKVERRVGHDVVGLSDILNILTHPDVIELTYRLVNVKYWGE